MDNKVEEALKKGLLAALGFASVTKEKAQEIAKELVKRGQASQKDAAVVTKLLLDKAKKSKEAIGAGIETTVEKIMARMDIPTRKEFDELKKTVARLKKESPKKKK